MALGRNPSWSPSLLQQNMTLYVIGKGLETLFPQATVIGCSTAGELVTGRMLKDSIVAQAMDGQLVSEAMVEVIPDLTAKDGV